MGWDGGINGWEHVQLGGHLAHLDFTHLSDKTGTPSSPSSQSLRPPSSQENYILLSKLAAPVSACPDVMLVWWCSGGYCPQCALMVSLMATSTRIPTGPPPPQPPTNQLCSAEIAAPGGVYKTSSCYAHTHRCLLFI